MRLLERLAAGTALLLPLLVHAQERRVPLAQGQDVVEIPGIGRVLLVFLFVAALAVLVAFALRRLLPAFGKGLTPSANLRVVDRASLGSGLRVQVVQFESDRILIAENRQGISMVVLSARRGGAES